MRCVYFPVSAPWLDELLIEPLAFPGVAHDDQVDSMSQALSFIAWREDGYFRQGTVIGGY